MHGFVRSLVTEWRRLELPFEQETIVVGVSGGADSISLLMAMHELNRTGKLNLRLVAAHFNHGIRGIESDGDEEYVRQLASKHGIELAVRKGAIETDGNLEQNARRARYKFLKDTAENLHAFAVLTGHTINDQAETFLINLIRGSGVEGLSAMRSVRGFGTDGEPDEPNSQLLLVRPLLSWAKRGDTEAYCHEIGVAYRSDTMNDDTAFKRVRIRKVLLPLLEDMNPKIVETLAGTAGLMQHVCDSQPVVKMPNEGGTLLLDHLRSLSDADLYSTLRRWLKERRGNSRRLELKHIKAIERLVFSPKSGRVAELPDGGRVVRSGGKLTYEENKVEN